MFLKVLNRFERLICQNLRRFINTLRLVKFDDRAKGYRGTLYQTGVLFHSPGTFVDQPYCVLIHIKRQNPNVKQWL